jgi:hypothetical protein
MPLLNPAFHVLDETNDLLLGHEYEYVYLVNKRNSKILILGGTYGDPAFGLISKNNNWCLAGGSWLYLWRKLGDVSEIDEPELSWVVKARQISNTEVELLIDPWSEYGAIWLFDVYTLQKKKIKDFKRDDNYEEDFVW